MPSGFRFFDFFLFELIVVLVPFFLARHGNLHLRYLFIHALVIISVWISSLGIIIFFSFPFWLASRMQVKLVICWRFPYVQINSKLQNVYAWYPVKPVKKSSNSQRLAKKLNEIRDSLPLNISVHRGILREYWTNIRLCLFLDRPWRRPYVSLRGHDLGWVIDHFSAKKIKANYML